MKESSSPKRNITGEFERSKTMWEEDDENLPTLQDIDLLVGAGTATMVGLFGEPGEKKKNFTLFDMPLFKDILNNQDRKSLEEALKTEEFKAGDVIFKYGKPISPANASFVPSRRHWRQVLHYCLGPGHH